MNYAKPVRRVLDRLRKLNYWQRIIVMDWLNGWYADVKEQEERELQEDDDYIQAQMQDECICREDYIAVNCPGCF
tara:strand:+ start:1574 stop:1798 length:225 start_codon:yes stop_codon:yes gene_type:complete